MSNPLHTLSISPPFLILLLYLTVKSEEKELGKRNKKIKQKLWWLPLNTLNRDPLLQSECLSFLNIRYAKDDLPSSLYHVFYLLNLWGNINKCKDRFTPVCFPVMQQFYEPISGLTRFPGSKALHPWGLQLLPSSESSHVERVLKTQGWPKTLTLWDLELLQHLIIEVLTVQSILLLKIKLR